MESIDLFFLGIASTFFGGIALLLLGLYLFAGTARRTAEAPASAREDSSGPREPASQSAASNVYVFSPLRVGRRTLVRRAAGQGL